MLKDECQTDVLKKNVPFVIHPVFLRVLRASVLIICFLLSFRFRYSPIIDPPTFPSMATVA
jgi:hypothetical protein